MEEKQPFFSERSRRRKLSRFVQHVPHGSMVLEVGSGDGWFSRRLRERGYGVTTLDMDAPADVVGNITDWRELGMKPRSYDAIIALEVIEHVDCLDDLTQLCKPNGLIFLSSPHPKWDWVMQLLESIGLTQRRTSPHDNLVDFKEIPLREVVSKRPLFIHQVSLFRNTPA